ncbi:Non-reducing polyketide synthase atr1 [Trichinella pseudospiralis]
MSFVLRASSALLQPIASSKDSNVIKRKQFRSLALERGYAVDEVYETSVKWSENGKIDPFKAHNGGCVCGQEFGECSEGQDTLMAQKNADK